MVNGKAVGNSVLDRVEQSMISLASDAQANAPRRPNASSEYKHILVPTRFAMTERAALRMALQIAYANHAAVTVLHVLRPEPKRSLHWLDAIDHLHTSLSSSASSSRHVGAAAIEPARNEIEQFLTRAALPHLSDLAVRAECRMGDVAEEVARFAEENGVDLIVLCSDRSPWSLPFWPGLSHRLMGLTSRQVVCVRPDTSPLDTSEDVKASATLGQ